MRGFALAREADEKALQIDPIVAYLFRQALFSNRENRCFETLPDWFVINLEPREIRS
jgi:hypothetical protein